MDMNTNGYNQNYSSYYSQNSSQQAPKPPKKKKGGTFKKIMTGALIGIIFGVFAGVGFIGIQHAGQIIKATTPFGPVLEALEDKKDAKEEVTVADNSAEDAIEETNDASVVEDVDNTDEAILKAEEKAEAKEEIKKSTLTGSVTTVVDVTDVVENVMPAVVSVNNKYTAKAQYWGQIYSQEARSTGSGIIVGQNDSELLIVTNHHVIDGEEELSVVFVDNEEVTAQLKGSDANRDLAVIAVQLSDIPSDTKKAIVIADMGDSDNLKVGEPVIAIGNALGYGQSVTTGVVSALNRTIASSTITPEEAMMDEEVPLFIQTDAAINPGNSGGALLNGSGQVIGINSNKIGGAAVEGMGYAIPISEAKPIIADLMNKETKLRVAEESRGVIGITGVNVESQYSEIYGMPEGIYISSVYEGSGADKAGLIRGDIIVAVNGEEVLTMDALKKQLEYYTQGTEITLTIMQGSPTGYQSKDVKVILSAPSVIEDK